MEWFPSPAVELVVERLDPDPPAVQRQAVRRRLRELLALRLGVRPRQVEIARGPQGKPWLSRRFAASGLKFNLARSGGLAVFAFSPREVGVDVERIRPVPEADALARLILTPQENAAYASLGPRERLAGFFAFWTRKEALVKALGVGLSAPLRSLDTTGATNFCPAPGFAAAACLL